jgi:hypothetical protein
MKQKKRWTWGLKFSFTDKDDHIEQTFIDNIIGEIKA